MASPRKKVAIDFEKGDRLGCKRGEYSIAERPNCTPAQPPYADELRAAAVWRHTCAAPV